MASSSSWSCITTCVEPAEERTDCTRAQDLRRHDKTNHEARARFAWHGECHSPRAMIDRFLPEPRLVQIDHVDVPVTPDRAYAASRHFDGATSPIVRALFALRSLPDKLAGRPSEPVDLRLDDLPSEGAGFHVLADEPGRGFVVAAVARPWEPTITFADVRSEDFLHFDQPGWAKIAWEIRFEPIDAGLGAEPSVGWTSQEDAITARTRIVFELRISATDEEAWTKTSRYFALIKPFSHFIRRHVLALLAADLRGKTPEEHHARHHDNLGDLGEGVFGALGMLVNFVTPFLRKRREHWGLDEAAANRVYPGDELVPEPKWSWTHGVEIDAPPERVWPWVAQIGREKAGFYSYQLLENVAGCEIQNADVVTEEWTHPKAGDELSLHPKMPPLRITAVEPGRYMVAKGQPEPGEDTKGQPRGVSWLFFVEPLGEGKSRFISRYRIDYDDGAAKRIAYGPAIIEPVGFMMDRKMLLGVKERVENRTLAD